MSNYLVLLGVFCASALVFLALVLGVVELVRFVVEAIA